MRTVPSNEKQSIMQESIVADELRLTRREDDKWNLDMEDTWNQAEKRKLKIELANLNNNAILL